MSELGRQLGGGGPVKNFDTNHMASLISTVETGGAGSRHRQTAGSVSGLADSRVPEAGSGHRGKSSEHPEKFRVATWNVGTLKKRQCEVVETLTRRRVDLCSVSEHRWAGGLTANQARILMSKDSKYKFFWCGSSSGLSGIGILLAERWVDKAFEVKRTSDRILQLKLVIGRAVFTFLAVNAPQVGLPEVEKERFYDQLQSTVARVPASEILVSLGDWNGHVGADADGFDEVHGGQGFGVRNA